MGNFPKTSTENKGEKNLVNLAKLSYFYENLINSKLVDVLAYLAMH